MTIASSSAMVAIEGLCKSFDGQTARIDILKDACFDVAAGETVAVVGPSGIGKSTFLHLLGALERPDRGRLLFNGEDVYGFDNDKLARFRNTTVGFVFQFHHLLPEFTALENVMMPWLINGGGRAGAREAASAILKRVGLGQRIGHGVTRLSGGEQQRVALARALMLKPSVLLADEPTGNLDKHNGDQVHQLLIELNREMGMTMVVVTHNLELAAMMSRMVTIVDGQLVQTH